MPDQHTYIHQHCLHVCSKGTGSQMAIYKVFFPLGERETVPLSGKSWVIFPPRESKAVFPPGEAQDISPFENI